jgi:3-deoxy-D-manno-octulosonate 8-phosphate phosphatase (KDO 8-P phosphatase)
MAGCYMSDQGETLKRFNILDGLGVKLLQKAGITPAVITGRDSEPLRLRLNALGIEHVHYGTENKHPAALSVLATLGLDWTQAAAMGDDWPDLPVMTRCAFAVAPANAHAEVRARAHWVTPSCGGQGAVRECCDALLTASGHYARLLREACDP